MNFPKIAFPALMMFFVSLSPTKADSTLERVLEMTKPNVVRVVGWDAAGTSSIGSGVLIRERFVVTAKHVLRGCTRAICEFDNGESIAVVEELRNTDDQSVLILNQVPDVRSEITVAVSDPAAGETVVFAGFDHGSRLRYYDAQIGVAGRFNGGTVSEANAAAISGNSGGGAFDSQGRFFGTLWGTDGVNTTLVSNASTVKFFQHVAERFPSFGRCFDNSPKTKLVPVNPVNPPIQQPQTAGNAEIESLKREIASLKANPTPQQWFEANRHKFKFQIVLRDRNGNEIDRDTVDAIGGELNLQFFEIK